MQASEVKGYRETVHAPPGVGRTMPTRLSAISQCDVSTLKMPHLAAPKSEVKPANSTGSWSRVLGPCWIQLYIFVIIKP